MNARRRSVNVNLPPRMIAVRKKDRTYYYYDTGGPKRYTPLGSVYIEAVRKWAELEQTARGSIQLTFKSIADRYECEEIPKKAKRTQADYRTFLMKVREWFDDAPLPEIEPLHCRQFLDWRRSAPVRANRELALFSAIWNKARNWGVTDRANPATGIERHEEKPRTTYIDDRQFDAIRTVAKGPLKDAMELAYLTGQRPSDVLRMRETDIRDGCLEVRQRKTGTPLRIAITGELDALLKRLAERKAGFKIHDTALIVGQRGKAISQHYVRTLWVEARQAAKLPAELQFRDLRAKAVSDKTERAGLEAAQHLAGHSTIVMTEVYERKRRGKKVGPVK